MANWKPPFDRRSTNISVQILHRIVPKMLKQTPSNVFREFREAALNALPRFSGRVVLINFRNRPGVASVRAVPSPAIQGPTPPTRPWDTGKEDSDQVFRGRGARVGPDPRLFVCAAVWAGPRSQGALSACPPSSHQDHAAWRNMQRSHEAHRRMFPTDQPRAGTRAQPRFDIVRFSWRNTHGDPVSEIRNPGKEHFVHMRLEGTPSKRPMEWRCWKQSSLVESTLFCFCCCCCLEWSTFKWVKRPGICFYRNLRISLTSRGLEWIPSLHTGIAPISFPGSFTG